MEPELYFPVRCRVCGKESLMGFRLAVVEEALQAGHIRLYAGCHVVSWEASGAEIDDMRLYLDATLDSTWGPHVAQSFRQAQSTEHRCSSEY